MDLKDTDWRKHPKAGEYAPIIEEAERRYRLPAGLLGALVHRESRFNPNAKSPAGAVGLVQLMPVHWEAVDPRSPEQSIPYAAKYLGKLYDRFGDWDKALAAYNFGQGNVSQLVRRRGKDWTKGLPRETSDYIAALSPIRNSFANDDVGEAWANADMEAYEQTLARAKEAEARENAEAAKLAAEYKTLAELEEQDKLRKENRSQLVDDLQTRAGDILLRAPAKAAVDLVNETFIAAKDMANWVLPIEGLVRGEAAAAASRKQFNETLRDSADELVSDPVTGFGSFEKSALQFVAGFATASRAITAVRDAAGVAGGLGALGDAAAAGFVVDSGMFDPDSGNLSDFLNEIPALKDFVPDFLATDPEDTEATKRLKNGLDGLAFGLATDKLLEVFKAFRTARAAKAREKEWESTAEVGREFTQPETPAPKVEPEAAPKADPEAKPKTPEELLDDAEARRADAEARGDTAGAEAAAKEAQAAVEAELKDPVLAKAELETRRARRGLKLDSATRDALADALMNGDLSKARGLLNFNGNYVDFTSIEGGDDIRRILNTFSELLEDEFSNVPRAAPISHEQTAAAAKALGLTQSDVARVFNDAKGLDARILAADQVMHASAARLQKLAEVARKLNPDTAAGAKARAEFLKQTELHAAIMAEVRGAKREVARALNAMKILKQPDELLFKDLEDVKNHAKRNGLKDPTEALIQRVIGARNSTQAHLLVREFTSRGAWDIITEVAINGLLSLPKTHAVNLMSNSVMALFGAVDRALAVAISPVRGALAKVAGKQAEAYTARAAMAYYRGMATGLIDGARAAAKAIVTRGPVTDAAQKIEFANRRAIRMETNGRSGIGLGLAHSINALGEIIRLPGVGLVAGDEFFKGIARGAALEERSYIMAAKQADAKGLKGEARDRFIAKTQVDIKADPPVELQVDITTDARYSTFQESPTTGFGQKAEKFVNAVPVVKLVFAPFFRTPMNILRQSFVDRTPLALFNESIRKDIFSGGPRANIALARIALGTSTIGIGFALAQKGIISGDDKWKDTEGLDREVTYSIQFGDTRYQFSRLDPIGSWLGFAADYHKYVVENYDPHNPDPVVEDKLVQVAGAFIQAIGKNALSKTWMKSLDDFLDILKEDADSDDLKKKLNRFMADNTAKLMPYSSLQRGITQTGDPVVRDAYFFGERLFRSAPLTTFAPDGVESPRELPPMRDYLGRPVTRFNAEWYWLNPIASSPESTDPLEMEMARLSYEFQPLPRTLDGVQLTTEQYSEFKRLIGQEPDEFFGGQNLESFLRELVQSSDYQALTETEGAFQGSKEATIKAYYSTAKSIAKQKLLAKYEDLDRATRSLKLKKAETLVPGSTAGYDDQ